MRASRSTSATSCASSKPPYSMDPRREVLVNNLPEPDQAFWRTMAFPSGSWATVSSPQAGTREAHRIRHPSPQGLRSQPAGRSCGARGRGATLPASSRTTCGAGDRPYSVEAVFRDDSGNWFSLTERRSDRFRDVERIEARPAGRQLQEKHGDQGVHRARGCEAPARLQACIGHSLSLGSMARGTAPEGQADHLRRPGRTSHRAR
jgi:hypothetical protein